MLVLSDINCLVSASEGNSPICSNIFVVTANSYFCFVSFILSTTVFRVGSIVVFKKGGYEDSPKNGKSRTIDVNPDVIELLRRLRQEQAASCISSFVFSQDGSPEAMHPQSPTRFFTNFGKKYGVDDFHPHKLRHTFASVAITAGADIASVSEKLGHSDKAVTLRMYTHADAESMKRASDIFREAVKKAAQA
ncbi:MAG: site-specific integrase [Oscillospiraceae bacterium]|nr:site-specific integrase [Oscillospiraceae bacterium]